MMDHHSRQPMPPTAARITVLQAENEALRRRVAQLEAELAAKPDHSVQPQKITSPQA